MVLDRLDNNRLALRTALKNERVLVAKELLLEIYDTEDALRAPYRSARRIRLGKAGSTNLMSAIAAAMVEAELSRFPDHVDHVLGIAQPARACPAHQPWPDA